MNGSWFMIHGSSLNARGSRPRKIWRWGPGPGGPSDKNILAVSREPWTMSEPLALSHESLIRHRAFRLVGRVWSPCLVFWFSDVLMSCFLLLDGTHSPTVGFPCKTHVPLFTFFLCLFFRPPFWQRLNPKALKMRAPKQLKIIKKCKKGSPKLTYNQDL